MSLTRCCSGASRKCRLIWTVTRLFDSLFDSAVETTESIVAACCHNHAEIKADLDAKVLSHAERGIRCPGIASSDADGKWFFRGTVTFSDPLGPDTKDVIFGAGELGIQVKMITGDHVAIEKETCRLIGIGAKIPTIKDTLTNEADTLLHSPFLYFTFLFFPIIFCSRCTWTFALRNSCWFDSVHRHTFMSMRTHF